MTRNQAGFLIATAVIALGVYMAARTNLARTIRLNNPGAMKITNNKWQGKVTPSRDSVFETFSSPLYGARAMLKNMQTQHGRGANTVRKMVSVWAPAGAENPYQANYIAFVSRSAGVSPDAAMHWDVANWVPVAVAMAQFEAGIPWPAFGETTFVRAWGLL